MLRPCSAEQAKRQRHMACPLSVFDEFQVGQLQPILERRLAGLNLPRQPEVCVADPGPHDLQEFLLVFHPNTFRLRRLTGL